MNLNFLGRGAAFNPKEGSNSAYFIDNDELFLIDAGETVFTSLLKSNILNNINKINIVITHTHSDHVGSLGSLILYAFYALKIPVRVIVPTDDIEYIDNLKTIIKLYGCSKFMYEFAYDKIFDDKYNSFNSIRLLETSHEESVISYGILFFTSDGIVYYSGDTNETRIIDALINSKEKIDKVYIDTTTTNFPGNPHLYLGFLDKVIPDDMKDRIYCMHINSDECIEEVKKCGYNVVEVEEYLKTKKPTNK